MTFILDANVVSELVAPKPAREVIDWINQLEEESVFLSVITIGALKKGTEKLPDTSRKRVLRSWLQGDLLVRFRDRILPLDLPTLLTWGDMYAGMEADGITLPAIDSLLAPTAAETGFTLATRNTSDFEATGIALVNPRQHPG